MLTAKDFVVESTSLESYLATVWCEFLSLEELEYDEDFFELGGDSVQAVKIANALQQSLGVDLQAARALKSATIEGLADYLRNTFPVEIATFLRRQRKDVHTDKAS
jgi:acyl carrier protein